MESNESKQNHQSELEQLRSKFFKNGINQYKGLMKEGLKRFDKNGDSEITNADGTNFKQSGNKFIEDLIKYFESKDSREQERKNEIETMRTKSKSASKSQEIEK